MFEAKLVTARADGSATIFGLTDQDTLKEQSSWQETRLKTGQRYVGLSLTQRYDTSLGTR